MLTQMLSIIFRRMEADVVPSNNEPAVAHSEDGSKTVVEEVSSSDHNDPTITLGDTLSMKQINSTSVASVQEMQSLADGPNIKGLEAVLEKAVNLEDGGKATRVMVQENTSVGQRDALLLFRTLCKMGMKEDNDEVTTKTCILSLELLQGLLEGVSNSFSRNFQFIDSIRTHLSYTLLRASMSQSPVIFKYATGIFAVLLLQFRESLKAEIGVFFPVIILRSLDGSDLNQKSSVLRMLEKVCKDPQILVDLYVNYIVILKPLNLFERSVLEILGNSSRLEALYAKWYYERIDGKATGAERQIRIDRFNVKNSTRFCFLLSTRAGGLGINLATADTVIIYDSDWNPHADLQATARAHRLGQTNKVMIFRLITRGTIEERMMQMTKKKMVLEHLVVGKLKNQSINQEQLDDIIRYGSKELFADDNDESVKSRQIHYDATAIDRLLDRDQVGDEETLLDDEEEDGFLKAFKVANFEYVDEAEVAAEEESPVPPSESKASVNNTERSSFWEDLLRDNYEVHKVEEFNAMGKGKRSCKQMVSVEEDDLAGLEDVSSDGEDDNYEAELTDNETPSVGAAAVRRPYRKRSRDTSDYQFTGLINYQLLKFG